MRLKDHLKGLSKAEIRNSQFFELYEFGYHVLKKFFINFEELGPKLVVELLFWKGAKECYDIEFGYGSYEFVSSFIYYFAC